MTDLEYGLEGLKLTAAIALLYFAYTRAFLPASLAAWRQDVFAARNALWDAMRAAGRLDAPAHRLLRDQYNGVLRFAESITVPYLLAVRLTAPAAPAGAVSALDEAIAAEPDAAVRKALADSHEALELLIFHRLFNSFPGVILWKPLAWRSRLARRAFGPDGVAARSRAFAKRFVRNAEESALAFGRIPLASTGPPQPDPVAPA